jgi:hypothetical protein
MELGSEDEYSFFSLEPFLEWIYGRKGKHIFSGSFSPLGFTYCQTDKIRHSVDLKKTMWTFGFMLLKYEYDRRRYLNLRNIKTSWFLLKDICKKESWMVIGVNFLSIEFGLNIIGVNDWRKKRKGDIEI